MVRFPTDPTLELSMSAVLQDRPEPGTVDLTRTLPGQEALLTPAAQTFLAGLHVRFEGERQARLAARRTRQAAFDAGALPDFRARVARVARAECLAHAFGHYAVLSCLACR